MKQTQEKKHVKGAPKESQSFTMNLFRGELQSSQVFPYPEVLNEEQLETTQALVDPFEKFFEVTKSRSLHF